MEGTRHILVTGADGFVGRRLCESLARTGHDVRRAVRRVSGPALPPSVATVGDIGPGTDWRGALDGAAAVVHLAARTHVLRETAADPLAEYRRINVEGARSLATQAAASGVRRLVFMSSVKVNGETAAARPFNEEDVPHPEDAYGISQWEAEQVLRGIERETGLEVVVLRPPLVYGPGVKGNFARLLQWVARGFPLPLAWVENRRSLIGLGNLVDAVIAAVNGSAAAGRTYLLSDGEDVSTPDLVRAMAAALGVAPRLLPFPVSLLELGARLAGRGPEAARLLGSLQVDSSAIRRELGWQPPHTLAEGLAETAQWYVNRQS
jgi:nucleoside-diphosphate-sugar epimerase